MIHGAKNKVRTLHTRSRLAVITGLVPVIPMMRSAAPHRIGIAGTSPAMTRRAAVRDGIVRFTFPLTSSGCGWRDGKADGNGGTAII
jgi:hypothetical protein